VYRARRPAGGDVRVLRRGGALELRVDGTFASLYREETPRTGSVWDALAAPILALAPERRRSLLVLGLGGGSAARLARALAPGARIVGVEIDPRVVALARSRLGLDELGLEVVRADAERFLARCRERFDAVLEDVFIGPGRAVRKPDWLLAGGLARAAACVAPGGVLASNALDEAPAVARGLAAAFPRVLRIDVAGYDNRILVGGPAPLAARALRAAVAASPLLAPSLANLSFRKGVPSGR
jgi:spermidine synthase